MENFTKLKELGEKELLLLDTQNFANNLVFAHTYFFSFLQVAATRYGGVFASILEDEIKGDQTHTEMILRDLGLSFNQLPITLLPEDPMQSFCKSCFGAIESRQLAEAFVAAVEQHAGEFFISLKKCFDKLIKMRLIILIRALQPLYGIPMYLPLLLTTCQNFLQF